MHQIVSASGSRCMFCACQTLVWWQSLPSRVVTAEICSQSHGIWASNSNCGLPSWIRRWFLGPAGVKLIATVAATSDSTIGQSIPVLRSNGWKAVRSQTFGGWTHSNEWVTDQRLKFWALHRTRLSLKLCGIQAYHGSPGSLILCGFCSHWIRKTMFFGSSGTWFLELSQNTFIFLWACTDAHRTIKGVCHFPRLASSLHPGAPTGVIVAHTCRAKSSVGHMMSGAYSYDVGTNMGVSENVVYP